ncbi:hypothetical protein QFZ48_004844 [Chitinophaga sp. W2I13]|uniref:hypothetical protein n=1 Tax=Chitinophaga sp. W2I13 TaxID=3373923 RepID=UPI003D1C8DDF
MKRHCALISCLLILISNHSFSQHLGKKQLLEDLMYYRDTLPVKHKNLFNKISKQEFENKVGGVAGKIDTLNDETFMVELFRLNVLIGDEHTRIEPQFKTVLPVKFTVFDDGIFVTGIAPQQSTALLSKLTAINGHSIDEINRKFKEVIKADNQSYFEVYEQQLLNNPSFLKGLGILSSDESAAFTLQSRDGEVYQVTVPAVHKDSLNIALSAQYGAMLPYREQNKDYWYEYDSARKTIYFNFIRCNDDEQHPFAQFNEELFSKINSLHPGKIIVDLRFNSGGNSGVLRPFIDSIKHSYLNKKAHFYVLIGKQTFSSALMNAVELKRYTNAILVGQMTSGNINHYGEVRGFRLPNTKIVIGYSTRYWENWKGKNGALMPDKAITYRSLNFINNKDEALEYIYKQ